MREFDLHNLIYSLHQLVSFKWMASKCHKENEKIDPGVAAEMEFLVEQLEKETRKLQLKASRRRASKELRWALRAYGEPKWGKMGSEFGIFWEILQPELRERRFCHIEAGKEEYLDDLLGDPPSDPSKQKSGPSPIWLNIWKRFPAARRDCQEAVYCYALERNTACVFHSMRVAELGLRALARRMKVKLPKGKPLEWGQWQDILGEMKDKTDAIGQTVKAGPRKDALLEFYNGAIGQFYGFKDEFRNQVMHVRHDYDEFGAASALIRVRDFMDKLARKINENGNVVKKTDRLLELEGK